jgi:glycosyltransferase involved in cell wall biosynthesis
MMNVEQHRESGRESAGPSGAGRSITIFLQNLRGGGAERVMVTLANELAAQGERPKLLLFSADGVYFDELNPDVPFRSLGIRGRLLRPLGVFGYWLHIRRRRPDIVIVSGHSAFLVAFLVRLFQPHRVLAVIHNTVSRERRLSSLIPRYLYRYADCIAAVSRGVADDFCRFTGLAEERVRVIYNAVDLERVDRAMEQPPEHPWMTDASVPVIVAVGRLMQQKRFDLLLRAFDRVRAKRRVRLVLLGEGQHHHDLRRLAEKLGIARDVHFAGFVKNPYSYLRHATMFALSSDYEGFAVVVIEALACRCPVVSTDCPSGPNEILEDGRWGRLVPTGDHAALADAIIATLDAPPDRDALRIRAEAFSAQEYALHFRDLLDRGCTAGG